jgi:hypothetical protein
VFTAAQEVAAFATSDRDEWIGDALRPPAPELDEQELELEAQRQAHLDRFDQETAAA